MVSPGRRSGVTINPRNVIRRYSLEKERFVYSGKQDAAIILAAEFPALHRANLGLVNVKNVRNLSILRNL